ncbi:hypothetical protein CC86DRAFT_370466 [Ophiobolus disseminans]|uniref:Uncharacterized protein n=1 Tax=Ophiobolus disseminans TaxID=1469910 RepID=A0A6A6ZZI9_9PLEO|nr:hypothetical protein CC86DRAFT_370466 [Ophiobolus disseminans]
MAIALAIFATPGSKPCASDYQTLRLHDVNIRSSSPSLFSFKLVISTADLPSSFRTSSTPPTLQSASLVCSVQQITFRAYWLLNHCALTQ